MAAVTHPDTCIFMCCPVYQLRRVGIEHHWPSLREVSKGGRGKLGVLAREGEDRWTRTRAQGVELQVSHCLPSS